jgi:hypothetical protein
VLGWGALAEREDAITHASAAAPAGAGPGAARRAPSLSYSFGHRLALPDAVSRLAGLQSLCILPPCGEAEDCDARLLPHLAAEGWAPALGAPQPTLVTHPTGGPLPAALAALGACLGELRVEGLVPPRRQLGAMTALRALGLSGWDAVTKMAVHLHKLPALDDLDISFDDAPDDGAVCGWRRVAAGGRRGLFGAATMSCSRCQNGGMRERTCRRGNGLRNPPAPRLPRPRRPADALAAWRALPRAPAAPAAPHRWVRRPGGGA